MTAALDTPRTSTKTETDQERRVRRQPPYHVVLLNDDDHSYDYVVRMLRQLFGYTEERSFLMAKQVDTAGRVIVATTSRERAELKRDQIHAFGPDPVIPACKGSMSAEIEPAE